MGGAEGRRENVAKYNVKRFWSKNARVGEGEGNIAQPEITDLK